MSILNIFSFELYNRKKPNFSAIMLYMYSGKAALVELHEFKTIRAQSRLLD